MRKLKSFSFYFLINFLIRKFIFVLFISAIFNSGFFVYAEEPVEEVILQEIIKEEITIEENNFTLITDDIKEDTIWTKEGSPYLVSNSILVETGVTLSIEAGVVVKFEANISRNSIYILGKIIANGTTEEPIYFTSSYDDIGGSTDDDYKFCDYIDFDEWGEQIGEETCEMIDLYEPSSGDWGGLYFKDSIDSELKNVIINYAEHALSFDLSNVNIEKPIISDSTYGLSAYKNSHVNIVGGSASRLEVDGFLVFENSSLSLEDFTLDGSDISVYMDSSINLNKSIIKNASNGIGVYRDSTVTVNDSNISSRGNGIDVYENSFLNLSGVEISCTNECISLYNNTTADIRNIKVTGANNAGIIAFANTATNTISITDSEITGNNYGFLVWDTNISVHQNSIHDNLSFGVIAYPTLLLPLNIDFKNNWWGDSSGPTHETSPKGLGDEVSDNVLFNPWLRYDPLLPRKDPVILIPGITGSYLNKNYGDKDEIWPNVLRLMSPTSVTDKFLNDLALNEDGTENTKFPIIPGDIIRGISSVHVFDYIIDKLKEEGYVEGVDLFVFPYDWRLSTKNTALSLNEKINTILLNKEFKKVDVIAHSMGGLVAKKYIKNNGNEKIDQLIFLGTPQLGSPKAFKTLMFGDSMGYDKLFLGLNPLRAKFISQNMPSVYELLPSQKYVDLNGSYIERLINKSNSKDLDYEGVRNLMIEKGRNPLMFPFAENLHDSIDDLDLSSVRSYNFVGCGSPTIGQIKFEEEKSWLGKILGDKEDFKIGYTDGDETVPLVSARESIETEKFYVYGVSHGSLPASSSVMGSITSILKDESINFSDILQVDDAFCGIKGDVLSTHSPVQIHVYDEDGNHTGPDENGEVEYGVLGVAYDVLEDVNYVFLPDGKNYKIVTKATNTGGFNLKIEEQEDEVISKIHNWILVPLTSIMTTGEIWIGPDYKTDEYELKIDDEGDGIYENNYKEGFDGTLLAEQTTSKNRKSGSYLKPEYYLPVLIEIVESEAVIENMVIVQENKKINDNINNKKEETDLREKLVNKEEQKINNPSKIGLLASIGNSDFKNNNLLWILVILLFLIIGVLVKKFKKL